MDNTQKIAIVGISCRFPGCYDQESLWALYQQRKTAIVEIPESRWSVTRHYSADFEKSKSLSCWAGLVEGFDRFDAPYFNLLPREVELMDPQQRISLELSIECLEDAGYGVGDVKGSNMGVFIGVCNFDYKERLEKSKVNIQGHLSTGTYTSLIPNRVSFYLDLKGPSVPIDTACSSSLVSLSYAMQSIQSGDCDAALVGGVSYLFSHTYFVAFSQAGMLSPTGQCRTFDKQADGYVRGEGAGMILIKPLDNALKDNDKIYGVIDAVAVNHGGSVASITSPSAYAQAQVIKKALQKANISANSVSYIESHGTGTPKGDPIEINGLKRAFRAFAKERGEAVVSDSCVISGSKANIGHLESASGMVGLIKGLLAIQKQRLLPIYSLNELNPKISLQGSPFCILTEECAWQPTQGVRRFGVSSFGFGGVNAHTIVSEYQDTRNVSTLPGYDLFAFSASSPQALRAYAFLISEFLQNTPSAQLCHCAYTLARRTNLPYRLAFSYQTRKELLEKLIAFANGIPKNSAATDEYTDSKQVMAWLNGEQGSLKELFAEAHHRITYVPPYAFQHQSYFPRELLIPELDDSEKEPSPNDSMALHHVEPVFSFMEWPHDEPMDDKEWRPVIFSMLEEGISSTLKKHFSAEQYVELPRLPNDASGSDWIIWYLNFMAVLIQTVEGKKTNAWLLLSERQDSWAGTLYAHALSLEKEFGLPCGWYQFAENTTSLQVDRYQKLLLQPFANSFCRQLAYHRDDGTLTLNALNYQVSVFSSRTTNEALLPGGKPSVLISGGAGGIGNIFAKYLANTFSANVVILGRRREDELSADCTSSEKGRIDYIQADCCERKSLGDAIEQMLKRYQKIDLILHSAGSLDDKSMFMKTESGTRLVVESKVIGCELLDELTLSLPIKQFIVFSSITAMFGNPGQTDYAAANQYLVEFAHRRNKRQAAGLCSGKTSAVYWPYWREGGMRLDQSALSMLRETTGTEALPTDDGIRIFNHVLMHQPAEICVVSGLKETIARALNRQVIHRPTSSDRTSLVAVILSVIAEVTGLAPQGIDLTTRFSELGIDSIAMQGISRDLRQVTGFPVTGVMLAKHSTVHALAEHMNQGSEDPQPDKEAPPLSRKPGPCNSSLPDTDEEGVAVIGLDLRMSHSEHWRDAWPLFSQKILAPESYPQARWRLLPDALTTGTEREEIQGYFIEDCLAFDHKFFGISRREAMLLDPQHRVLIESVWSAIVDAGYSSEQFSHRKTAVLVCIDANDYALIAEFDSSIDEFSIGSSTPYLSANRLSHLFDLKGPSETVNVACASVYCAIEKAKALIDSGVVEQVVVAATQINLLPSRFKALAKRNLLSMDGVVNPFDQDAHGFIRSEGVGCILLKSLKLAIADGDEVLVTVKSAATWHGGQGYSFTAPNALTHLDAMNTAFGKAPEDVKKLHYIEAHGIASNIGDVSEAEAIATFLSTSALASCSVSSMKSNIGHLEICSGIAGMVRAILAIRHQQVPGIPQLRQLHPDIDSNRLHISNSNQPFTEPDGTIGLLAYGLGAVSSFVVLQPFAERLDKCPQPLAIEQEALWFCLSAQDPQSLKRYVASVIEQIYRYRSITPLPQLISTLRFHRNHLTIRLAVSVSSYDELLGKLEAYLAGAVVPGLLTSMNGLDDAEILADLPERVRLWLKKKESDKRMPPSNNKRSFWPKYPFERSSMFFIMPKGKTSN